MAHLKLLFLQVRGQLAVKGAPFLFFDRISAVLLALVRSFAGTRMDGGQRAEEGGRQLKDVRDDRRSCEERFE